MKLKSYPLISVIIPTYNEEKNIKACLDSIYRQDYPKNKLETIVVDDKSTDNTVNIVKKYPVKFYVSGAHHGEISKMIGLHKSTGDYVVYFDADIELLGTDWFTKMINPFMKDPEIIGTFTCYYPKKGEPAFKRYVSFDPLQRDTIYQYFSPSIESTIVKNEKSYFLCEYKLGKIPPSGLCLYPRKKLYPLVKHFSMYLELDFLVIMVKNGYTKFAYVPKPGLFHRYALSLKELLRKRAYSVRRVYLTHVDRKLYTWFDLTNPVDIIKIIIWIIYVNLIIPSVLVGIYKTIKFRDWAGMYEPITNFAVTNYLLWLFLIDSRGRQLILSSNEK